MSAAMETRARIIFRNALAAHYIDGITVGDSVDLWLKTHGGWFPDPQEIYGDGTPLTQPIDEGDEVMSTERLQAMLDAKALMIRLCATLDVECHSELKESTRAWIKDSIGPISLPRERSRSRSPIRTSSFWRHCKWQTPSQKGRRH